MRARALTTLMLVFGMAITAGPAFAQAGGATAPDGDEATTSQSTTPPPEPETTSEAEPVDPEDVGGAQYGSTASRKQSTNATPIVAGTIAKLLPDGRAAAPADAPAAVQQAIWAANRIVRKPYIYGGGHRSWKMDRGYDCSGTVSWALRGGRMGLRTPLDSGSFMKWGAKGAGDWVTIYTNPGHAFVVIAGLRLDTSAAGDPSGAKGPRWRPVLRETKGFVARHPVGL